MFGQSFKCQSCNDFDACKKCYGRIDEYHSQIRKEDGRPHDFKVRQDREQEFQDAPALIPPGSAAPNEQERGNGSRGRQTPEDTALEEGDTLIDLDVSDDSDELEFSDPNDLYEDVD